MNLATCTRCRTIAHGKCTVCHPAATLMNLRLNVCKTNICGHFKAGRCELLRGTGCTLEKHALSGKACPDNPPQFVARQMPHRTANELRTSRLSKIDIPKPSSTVAIVTCVVGKRAEELAEHTMEPLDQYAKRCGADLVVLTDDQFPELRVANKFQTVFVAKEYERTAFIDIDVLIRDHAPNIFEEHEPGTVWIHQDRPFCFPDIGDRIIAEIQRMSAGNRLVVPHCAKIRMRNSGVVLSDREHCQIWNPLRKIPLSHTAEQSSVEIRLIDGKIPNETLHWKWNLQAYFERFEQLKRQAYFLHFAGIPHTEKIKCLKTI